MLNERIAFLVYFIVQNYLGLRACIDMPNGETYKKISIFKL